MSLETAERRPPPFDAMLRFKILILQSLYNLSDDQTKYQVRDRPSFMRFLRLDLDHRIPAAKTIWLFREALTEAQMMKTLFDQFETYLAPNGLQARGKIHYKGSRNKALTAQQHTRNRARSRIRARVEHVFGHQVTAMGGKLICTIDLLRARTKIGFKNLSYNLQQFLILTMPRKIQGT